MSLKPTIIAPLLVLYALHVLVIQQLWNIPGSGVVVPLASYGCLAMATNLRAALNSKELWLQQERNTLLFGFGAAILTGFAGPFVLKAISIEETSA